MPFSLINQAASLDQTCDGIDIQTVDEVIHSWNVPNLNVGQFSRFQRAYLIFPVECPGRRTGYRGYYIGELNHAL